MGVEPMTCRLGIERPKIEHAQEIEETSDKNFNDIGLS